MGESIGGIPQGQDRSISLAKANAHTPAVSLPLVGLMLAAYLALSPAQSLPASGFSLVGGLLFLVPVIAGILVHEGIHRLAWAASGRLPLSRVTLCGCGHSDSKPLCEGTHRDLAQRVPGSTPRRRMLLRKGDS